MNYNEQNEIRIYMDDKKSRFSLLPCTCVRTIWRFVQRQVARRNCLVVVIPNVGVLQTAPFVTPISNFIVDNVFVKHLNLTELFFLNCV